MLSDKKSTTVEIYEDIMHLYYNGYIETLPKSLQVKFIAISYFGKLNKIVFSIVGYLKKWLNGLFKKRNHIFNKSMLEEKVWIFAETINQFEALKNLADKIEDKTWVGLYNDFGHPNYVYLFGLKRVCFWFKFLGIFTKLKKNNKVKAKRYAEVIFEISGLFEYCIFLLRKYNPQKIIVSNDHNFFSRSLLHAARQCNIPTVYVQHASVSKYFPPLIANLNLLEGMYSLETYRSIGINGIVKLIGMAKFDNFLKYRKSNVKLKKVGVALNPADDLRIIVDLLTFLAGAFPHIVFCYRKHPKDARKLNFEGDSNIIESKSNNESAFDYLRKIDMLIAGDSSIHLEATLMNIPCVYFCLSGIESNKDYYGFIKNGLIDDAKSLKDVYSFIKSYNIFSENVYLKAKYYNELVGTDDEGMSTELAVKFINNI